MKTFFSQRLPIVIIFSFYFSASHSQNNLLLNGDSAVWFGVDFSNARFSGSFADLFGSEDSASNETINTHFRQWNDFFINEPLNYDIGGAIKKLLLFKAIKSVNSINKTIIVDSLMIAEDKTYKIKNPETTIQSMVEKYESKTKKSGLGCSLIVESFNKKGVSAYFYFVMFDIESKQVIGYKRLWCIPKGMGIRNYWGGAIKDCIKQIGTSAYPAIVQQASKK